MYPVLLQVDGGASVAAYGTFVILGFVAVFLWAYVAAERAGVDIDQLPLPLLVSPIGGLLGARLFTLLTTERSALLDPSSALSLDGLTLYGGVIGGVATVWLAVRFMGLRTLVMADLLAPGLMLGLGVGRIGCFLGGCCHGAPVELSAAATAHNFEPLKGLIWLDTQFPFMANEFHAGVGRYLHTPLYPTQLASAAGSILLAIGLMVLFARRRFTGQVAAAALITEPVLRAAVESYRGDVRGTAFSLPAPSWLHDLLPGLSHATSGGSFGLTTSQVVGVGLVMGGVFLWRWASRQPQEPG